MNRHSYSNKELDRLGQAIFRSTKGSETEIQKIVDQPHLFQSVLDRIPTVAPYMQRIETSHAGTGQFSTRRFALVTGIAAVFLMTIFTVTPLKPPLALHSSTPATSSASEAAPTDELVKHRVQPVATHAELAIKEVKPNRVKPSSVPQSIGSKKKRLFNGIEALPDTFYALNGSADWDLYGDLQIVHRTLTRADLFSMGIPLPYEDPDEKIRVDLLVEVSGMPRAIKIHQVKGQYPQP